MNFEKLPIISVEQPQHEVHAGEEWQWGPSGCQEGFHRGLRIWNFILEILISIGLSCLTSEGVLMISGSCESHVGLVVVEVDVKGLNVRTIYILI